MGEPTEVAYEAVHDEPERGSDAEHCSRWPAEINGEGHAMESFSPAGTAMWIRRCSFCGWIDGADLQRQRAEAVAEGRRQAAEAIIAHRDEFWPKDERLDSARARVRRHLNIAVQVANPPTEAEVRQAIGDLLGGLAARSIADGGERPAKPTNPVDVRVDHDPITGETRVYQNSGAAITILSGSWTTVRWSW